MWISSAKHIAKIKSKVKEDTQRSDGHGDEKMNKDTPYKYNWDYGYFNKYKLIIYRYFHLLQNR